MQFNLYKEEENMDLEKNSVERTLCIPLWSRAIAVKKLPDLLPDHDAVRILEEMGEKKPPTIFYNLECAALAGAVRQYDLACEVNEYLKSHPSATVVELGAGLSCLRRQIGNTSNPWINIDLPEVVRLRERYIPSGDNERNIAADITDHRWFESIPFDAEKGAIFLAGGVLHYLTHDDVEKLISEMARRFPGAWLVFDFVSAKGKRSGNSQIRMTDNAARIRFSMENAERELPAMSEYLVKVVQKRYMDGYLLPGMRFSPLTRLYIRSKRNNYYVVHAEFGKTR